jgi:hypothetical protein
MTANSLVLIQPDLTFIRELIRETTHSSVRGLDVTNHSLTPQLKINIYRRNTSATGLCSAIIRDVPPNSSSPLKERDTGLTHSLSIHYFKLIEIFICDI